MNNKRKYNKEEDEDEDLYLWTNAIEQNKQKKRYAINRNSENQVMSQIGYNLSYTPIADKQSTYSISSMLPNEFQTPYKKSRDNDFKINEYDRSDDNSINKIPPLTPSVLNFTPKKSVKSNDTNSLGGKKLRKTKKAKKTKKLRKTKKAKKTKKSRK